MWFDPTVVESVVESLPLWAAVLALVFSYLGSIYVIVPVTVWVYLKQRTEWADSWPVFVISAYALFVFLKPLSAIERPGVDSPFAEMSLPLIVDQLHHLAVDFDTESFPSGHAIAATVFYGLLVVDTDIGAWWGRVIGATVIVIGVYFSRIALGVHYLGDVVGGALIGVTFLVVLLWLRARVQKPTQTLLVIPAVLAIGAALAGRPIDGVGLLIAIGGFSLLHTRFGSELQRRFAPQ